MGSNVSVDLAMIIRRSFRLAVLLGAVAWGGQAMAEVPSYFACKADADCVLVQGVCGIEAGANAGQKAEAEAYFQKMQTMMKCRAPLEQPKKHAVCDAGRCVARNAETHEGR